MNTEDKKQIMLELDYIEAKELALCDKFDEAEVILLTNGKLPSDPKKLDLLARISVQRDDYNTARQYWEEAIKLDPEFEPAIKALSRLNSPWKLKAGIKRIAQISLLSILLCFALVGAYHLAKTRDIQMKQNDQISLPQKESPIPTSKLETSKIDMPDIPGCKIEYISNAMIISFEEGLFREGILIKEQAKEKIIKIANALKDKIKDKSILIEGNADSLKIIASSHYRDNYSLGMDRARIVAEFLIKNGILKDKIITSSIGDDSNLNNDNKPDYKNRNVIIKVIPIIYK